LPVAAVAPGPSSGRLFEQCRGRRHVRPGRAQDRVGSWRAPGREGLAERFVVGVFGRDHEPAAGLDLLAELRARRLERPDPLRHLAVADRLAPLGVADLLRRGRPERPGLNFRVPLAQLGVGGRGQAQLRLDPGESFAELGVGALQDPLLVFVDVELRPSGDLPGAACLGNIAPTMTSSATLHPEPACIASVA
jgi:hypothetical protein